MKDKGQVLEKDIFEGLVFVTFINLLLCAVGVGLLVLPFTALIWIFYFGYRIAKCMTVGGGIALAGIIIAAALYFLLK